MKQLFKKHKYLLPSATVLIALLAMLFFDAKNIVNFVTKLWYVFLYAALTAFGIYILSMFSGWLLFPVAPKYEDFSNDEERERYFDLGSWDLFLFIFLIIATTLVFSSRI